MHHERRNMNDNKSNDLQTIITQVIEEMKYEQGHKFDLNKINLAELERRTGMTRAQLRRLQKNGFQITSHALTGRKADTTIISAFCGARRTLMRFRADAMQSITDAPKRSILLFSSSAGLLLYSASSPA